MNKIEFMRELERLLYDIAPAEREEILQYYSDYISDAGEENEEDVIRSLGSVQRVADTIKQGLFGVEEGAFTEKGYQDVERPLENNVAVREQPVNKGQTDTQQEKRKRNSSLGMLILLIIVGICAAPLLAGFGATFFSLLVAVAAVFIGVFAATAAVAAAMLIAGVVLAGLGIGKLFFSPIGGITLLGGGIVCTGIGLLFLALTIWFIGSVVPALIRLVVDLFSRLFHRKGVRR